MQKDLLPPSSELVTATAYPVAPTHIVHVSTDLMPVPAYPMQPQARAATRWVPIAVTAALALTASYAWFRPAPSSSLSHEPVLSYVRATKAPLDACLIEQGVLEAKTCNCISNPVSASPATVVSMLPYGSKVKQGDVVAKLDLAPLHSAIADQQSKILTARMKLTETQEALDALKTKNEGELSSMDLQLEFAQIDLTRYQNEEKQVELNDRRSQTASAERDLREAEEKLSYYRTFHKRGFISSEQLKAKEAELERTRFNLAQSQSRLKIFERYTVPRQERQLQAKVDEVKREHAKLKKGHAVAIAKAQADIGTAKNGLIAEETRLTSLQKQLAFTEVKAPRDGILAAPLAEAQKSRPTPGATLQPSQVIFTMPQMETLCVKVRLCESEMRKLQLKQLARITVDGDEEVECTGTLERLDFQADATWSKTDTLPRDFVAVIKLTSKEPLDWTLIGQKAKVEFTLETLPEAIQVPASAITEKDGKSYVMVMTQEGVSPRELRTGSTNGKNVEIRQGLEAGEKVILGGKLRSHDDVVSKVTAMP